MRQQMLGLIQQYCVTTIAAWCLVPYDQRSSTLLSQSLLGVYMVHMVYTVYLLFIYCCNPCINM